MAKKKTTAAPVTVAPAVVGTARLRVVRPVEGRKVGDEFEALPGDYRLQIKHGSIQVIE